MVGAVIGVGMHSHSGGVHFRRTPGVNLAEQMRRGRMTAECLCHTGDGPVIRAATTCARAEAMTNRFSPQEAVGTRGRSVSSRIGSRTFRGPGRAMIWRGSPHR